MKTLNILGAIVNRRIVKNKRVYKVLKETKEKYQIPDVNFLLSVNLACLSLTLSKAIV
jgi:hypothetical protein